MLKCLYIFKMVVLIFDKMDINIIECGYIYINSEVFF